jgi:galactose mutarotase-like enzyme
VIAERQVGEHTALVMGSDGPDGIEASFVPSAGMVGCSLRHRGEELLGQRGGLARYVEERSTMGIPLLHPWANRVAVRRFSVAGRTVDLWAHPGLYTLGPKGLPIHGLLAAADGWSVEQHEDTPEGPRLSASFDFTGDDHRMAVFPFPHELRIEAGIADQTLTIATTVRASGDAAVPIAFGYHPYLRLPDVERSAWHVEIPVSERVVLDSEELPTGEVEPAEVPSGPLGSRTFDDEFAAPADPFVLEGGGRRIEVSLLDGYPYAQVYAPEDDDVIAFEPMTAPTNALVDDGPALQLVSPGGSYQASFSIAVSGA